MFVVESPGAGRQPQLMERRLGVDDEVAAVRQLQIQQPAAACGVDVDDVCLLYTSDAADE